MELVKAYTFITKEDNWIVKILIAAVIALFSALLIPIFFLYGYQLAVTRNVMDGQEHPLPEWQDWGQLFMEGAILWVARLVYALPLMLTGICYPLVSFATLDSNTGEPSGVGVALYSLLGCVMLIYGIFMAFVVPALYIQYARTGEFGAMFRLGEIIDLVRNNVVDILLTLLANIAAGIVFIIVLVISAITICGPMVLGFLAPAWISIANGHLYGQIAARDSAKKAGMAA